MRDVFGLVCPAIPDGDNGLIEHPEPRSFEFRGNEYIYAVSRSMTPTAGCDADG